MLSTIDAVKNAKDLDDTKAILLKAGVDEAILDGVINIINVVGTFSTSTKVVYDITVIRGQGYYTGTVFELYDESSDFT
ncbi:MAG: ATP phosphoribosyltransferase regulatory subunit, partial [Clostridia bacterium]|nr:ATP phosphoribosyltransferase regulatory subunit [Clostridia bacterium]